MISTLSKQGGRRYPQMGATGLAFHGWLPGVGGTVTPPVPAAPDTSTPGFLGRVPDYRRYETEEEKRERRIREGTIPAPFVPAQPAQEDLSAEYVAKSALLAAGIAKARAEAQTYRRDIERLEAAQERRQTAKRGHDLLLAQQALQLAALREAVLLEEMEVLDVAYVSIIALSVVLQ